MEKIIKEFNVYTIEELKELFPEAYEHAIEKEQEVWSETTFYYEADEFKSSIKETLKALSTDIQDWSIGIYDRSYMKINLEGYMALENSERNELVKQFADMIDKERKGACSFTGVYTDCYFFDGLAAYEDSIESLNYNNFHKAIEYAVDFAVSRFQTDLESSYADNELHEENLRMNDCLFTEDGKPYYK